MVGTCLEPEQITVFKGAMKSLRLSLVFGYEPDDFRLILDLLSLGRISSQPLISATISLDQVPSLFQSLLEPNDHCKVMIRPGEHEAERTVSGIPLVRTREKG